MNGDHLLTVVLIGKRMNIENIEEQYGLPYRVIPKSTEKRSLQRNGSEKTDANKRKRAGNMESGIFFDNSRKD
jgi:hypothetical protein